MVPDLVQLSSKPIIKSWEELKSNKNQQGLGYDKDENNLHIPDYSRPIKFVNAGFLAQITSASSEKVENKQKYTQPKLKTNRNTRKLKLQSNKNAFIVKELVIWKIDVLISILVTIVASQIIHQRNAANTNNQAHWR